MSHTVYTYQQLKVLAVKHGVNINTLKRRYHVWRKDPRKHAWINDEERFFSTARVNKRILGKTYQEWADATIDMYGGEWDSHRWQVKFNYWRKQTDSDLEALKALDATLRA